MQSLLISMNIYIYTHIYEHLRCCLFLLLNPIGHVIIYTMSQCLAGARKAAELLRCVPSLRRIWSYPWAPRYIQSRYTVVKVDG